MGTSPQKLYEDCDLRAIAGDALKFLPRNFLERESCYLRVLNKIYLRNFLYAQVEPN